MKKLLVLLAVVPLLAGCLSVHTVIELDKDGGGQIDLVYSIDADFYNLGVFDASDTALPIPVSRNQFRDTAARIPGLRLRRYRVTQDADLVTVTARMSFDSVDTLNAFFGGGQTVVTTTQDASETVWRQTIAGADGAHGETALALAESLEEYELSFTLRPGAPVHSSQPGQISDDGRAAQFSVSLADLVRADSPVIWEVRW